MQRLMEIKSWVPTAEIKNFSQQYRFFRHHVYAFSSLSSVATAFLHLSENSSFSKNSSTLFAFLALLSRMMDDGYKISKEPTPKSFLVFFLNAASRGLIFLDRIKNLKENDNEAPVFKRNFIYTMWLYYTMVDFHKGIKEVIDEVSYEHGLHTSLKYK